MVIYTRMRGRLEGGSVDAELDAAAIQADRDLLGEDSAVRGIYKADKAFFDILGFWCKVIAPQAPKLPEGYREVRAKIAVNLVTEDSAYRADSAYTTASLVVLSGILTAKGHGLAATQVVTKVNDANRLEDSAPRAAMRNAEGITGLLLILLAADAPDAAGEVRRSMQSRTLVEDSVYRAHTVYKQGTVQALMALIQLEAQGN